MKQLAKAQLLRHRSRIRRECGGDLAAPSLDAQAERYKSTWRAMEHSFNAIFLIELLVNMYGSWMRPFWKSGWNVFDFIVVCVGCVSFGIELQGR